MKNLSVNEQTKRFHRIMAAVGAIVFKKTKLLDQQRKIIETLGTPAHIAEFGEKYPYKVAGTTKKKYFALIAEVKVLSEDYEYLRQLLLADIQK